MKKDLVKIKKLSSDLLLKRSQTNLQDVKLHNDVEVSFSFFLQFCVVNPMSTLSLPGSGLGEGGMVGIFVLHTFLYRVKKLM